MNVSGRVFPGMGREKVAKFSRLTADLGGSQLEGTSQDVAFATRLGPPSGFSIISLPQLPQDSWVTAEVFSVIVV